MAKMGRPLIEIDKAQFENLCSLQCTKQEIAGWFGCSEDTIERWCKRTYGETFAATFAQKRSKGQISVRRALYQAATKGNTTAMIFWLKNHAGMADQIHLENKDITDDTVTEMEAFFAKQRANLHAPG